jgi:hypothetical protein
MVEDRDTLSPQRSHRVLVYLSVDELAALDEFRFRARMPSLAAAAREILKRGLRDTKE